MLAQKNVPFNTPSAQFFVLIATINQAREPTIKNAYPTMASFAATRNEPIIEASVPIQESIFYPLFNL